MHPSGAAGHLFMGFVQILLDIFLGEFYIVIGQSDICPAV